MTGKQYLTVIVVICGAIAGYELLIGFSLVQVIVFLALVHLIPIYGPRMIEVLQNPNQNKQSSPSGNIEEKTETRP